MFLVNTVLSLSDISSFNSTMLHKNLPSFLLNLLELDGWIADKTIYCDIYFLVMYHVMTHIS